jgi:hypothetical protein
VFCFVSEISYMAVSAVGDFLVFLRRVCCNPSVQHRLTEHRWLKTLLTIISGTDEKGQIFFHRKILSIQSH